METLICVNNTKGDILYIRFADKYGKDYERFIDEYNDVIISTQKVDRKKKGLTGVKQYECVGGFKFKPAI